MSMSENQFFGFLQVYDWVVLDTNVIDSVTIGRNASLSERFRYRNDLGAALLRSKRIVTSPQIMEEMSDAVSNLSDVYNSFFELTPIRVVYPGELGGRYEIFYEHLKPLAEEVGIVKTFKKFPYADVQLAAVALSLCSPKKKVAFLSTDMALNDLVYSFVAGVRNSAFDLPVGLGMFKPYRFSSRAGNTFYTFLPHSISRERTHPLLLSQTHL